MLLMLDKSNKSEYASRIWNRKWRLTVLIAHYCMSISVHTLQETLVILALKPLLTSDMIPT